MLNGYEHYTSTEKKNIFYKTRSIQREGTPCSKVFFFPYSCIQTLFWLLNNPKLYNFKIHAIIISFDHPMWLENEGVQNRYDSYIITISIC